MQSCPPLSLVLSIESDSKVMVHHDAQYQTWAGEPVVLTESKCSVPTGTVAAQLCSYNSDGAAK